MRSRSENCSIPSRRYATAASVPRRWTGPLAGPRVDSQDSEASNRVDIAKQMSPLMLVNWHALNLRFRALMWIVAAVLAFVILVSSLPTQNHPRGAARAVAAANAALNGRP